MTWQKANPCGNERNIPQKYSNKYRGNAGIAVQPKNFADIQHLVKIFTRYVCSNHFERVCRHPSRVGTE